MAHPVEQTVERLRLATALAHAVPGTALELSVEHGPHVVVSSDDALAPDVSPCELRRLVGDLTSSGHAAFGSWWLHDVTAIRVGGNGVHCVDGIVTVRRPDRLTTAFATQLDDAGVLAAAREVGAELVAEDPCAVVVLRRAHLRVHHDPGIGASAVTAEWSTDEAEEAQLVTAAVALRCWVDELASTIPARRS